MNVDRMLDQLGERIEDAAKKNFNNTLKLEIINNNVVKLVGLLHPSLLTELEKTKSNLDVSATGEAGEAGVANLTTAALGYNVVEGKKGVRNVKVYGSNGLWVNPIDFVNVKELESQYRKGTSTNPKYWIFQNKIYLQPNTITAIDVHFLRMPSPLLYEFSTYISGGGSTTQFVGSDGEGLQDNSNSSNPVDNYYNGAVIYSTKHDSYHIVTGYNYTSKLFTVSPAAATVFSTGYKFFFLTHDFDHLNLDSVYCDLNPSLHELIITLAEEECWAIDANIERCKLAREKAYDEINVRNKMAEEKEIEEKE